MEQNSMKPDTTLEAAWCPAVNFEPRRDGRTPTILLLHYTGLETAERALKWLCMEESRVSCHYLVDEAGRIFQMVREECRAWHAGESFWAGDCDVNSASIGIEIHNAGHSDGYPAFPEVQMQAVIALSQDIVRRHAIAPELVLAHSDVAPRRKRDPGEKFDWARLARAGVGRWLEPAAIEGDEGMDAGARGEDVYALQRQLAAYGYGVEATGVYDDATQFTVTAFQRHFRPALVNGRADRSTLATLRALLSTGAA